MSILDSIQKAREQGASSDMIIAEIARQNPDKATQFQQAQKMGANSDMILTEIVKQNYAGNQPTRDMSQNQNSTIATYNPAVEKQKSFGDAALSGLTKTAVNLVPSALNAVGGVASAVGNVFNPNAQENTIVNLGKTLLGGVEKLIPGKQSAETSFDGAINYFKDRYSSLDNITKTAVEDPFSFATDIMTIFTGGAGLAAKVGKLGEVAKASQVAKASTVANVPKASKVSSLVQESIMNLTPAKKIDLGNKVQQATDFIVSRGYKGTAPMQLNSVNKDILKLENTLQPVIRKASETGIVVPAKSVIDDLTTIKDLVQSDIPTYKLGETPQANIAKNLRNQPDTQSFIRRIDSEIRSLKGKNDLAVEDAYARKRSYSTGRVKDGAFTPADLAEKAIGDIYYKNVSKQLADNGYTIANRGLEDFNKIYSSALNARDVLEYARTNARTLAKTLAIGGGALFGNMIAPGAGGLGGALTGFASPAQKTIQAGMNIGKSLLNTNVPSIVPAVSSASNIQPSGEQEYLNSLGL